MKTFIKFMCLFLVIFFLHPNAWCVYIKCSREQAEEAVKIGGELNTLEDIKQFFKEWRFQIGPAKGEISTPFSSFVSLGIPFMKRQSFVVTKELLEERMKKEMPLTKEMQVFIDRRIDTDEQRKMPRAKDLKVIFKGKIYEPIGAGLDQEMDFPYVARDYYVFKIKGLAPDTKLKFILDDSITQNRYVKEVDLSKMR